MDTSWLSSLFGSGEGAAAGSSGGASWIGPLISALGSVASKTKWTPRRDATQEDIDKANRNNMLMALLGAGAEAYGNYQQQEAMGSLSDVFAKGGMTTTASGLPGTEPKQLGLAESIFEWGKQNPQFAAKALELGSAAQQQDKENRIAAAKALGKGPGNWGLTQDYQAARIGEALDMGPAANLAQMQEQKEAFEKQARAQEDQRRAILGDLLGTVTPGRPMTSVAPQAQPATAQQATPSILPPADMGQFIQGLAKATKAGQDFNVTVAPGANMDAAARALEQEGFKDWGYTEPPASDAAPFLAGPQAPATPTPGAMTAMQRGVVAAEQIAEQERKRKAAQERISRIKSEAELIPDGIARQEFARQALEGGTGIPLGQAIEKGTEERLLRDATEKANKLKGAESSRYVTASKKLAQGKRSIENVVGIYNRGAEQGRSALNPADREVIAKYVQQQIEPELQVTGEEAERALPRYQAQNILKRTLDSLQGTTNIPTLKDVEQVIANMKLAANLQKQDFLDTANQIEAEALQEYEIAGLTPSEKARKLVRQRLIPKDILSFDPMNIKLAQKRRGKTQPQAAPAPSPMPSSQRMGMIQYGGKTYIDEGIE